MRGMMGCGCSCGRGSSGPDSDDEGSSVSARLTESAKARLAWKQDEQGRIRTGLKNFAYHHKAFIHEVNNAIRKRPSPEDSYVTTDDFNISRFDVPGNNSDICVIGGDPLKLTLHHIACQTDPVTDEFFDWDLSDRADIETQTVPSSRAGSTLSGVKAVEDAIVQTDQRLVFLLHRESNSKNKSKIGGKESKSDRSPSPRTRLHHGLKKTVVKFHDAWSQTHTEVIEIGIQVCPDDLDDEDDEEDLDSIAQELRITSRRRRRRELFSDDDLLLSPITTQSDAGFQVDLTGESAPVAIKSDRGDISSPVGILHRSLNFNASLDDDSSLAQVHKPTVGGKRPMRGGTKPLRKQGTKKDVGIQTDNDIITDEAPNFRAKPPPMRKYELIGQDSDLFNEIDEWVQQISEEKRYKSIRKLTKVLMSKIPEVERYEGREELIKVRAFFMWVAENIKYDESYMEEDLTTTDILRLRRGVCREYVKIFNEMCEIGGIRVKNLKGFAKGHDFLPGNFFRPGGEGLIHAWNAVFICDSWRLIDCTWGSGSADQVEGGSQGVNEHFFLTDPDELIFTHFPYDEVESHYDRWQLLDDPCSLDEFNAMPRLTSMFFEYSLRLDSPVHTPIDVSGEAEINVWAWEVVRYKFKLYDASKRESDAFNHYAMCYLTGPGRKLGRFRVMPPEVGKYYLKIYAKPEEEITSEHDTLDHVATFLLEVHQTKTTILPWPRLDCPWGVTPAYFESEAILVGGLNPVISMHGNHKVVFKTPKSPMLAICHIYDSDGNELVQDKDRDVKYTVLLNRKKPLPSSTFQEEESSLSTFISKEETEKEIIFHIEPPPKVGFYKLQIFGRKKPRKRGKLKLPLIANLLIEYKMQSSEGGAGPPGARHSRSVSQVSSQPPSSLTANVKSAFTRMASAFRGSNRVEGVKSASTLRTTVIQDLDDGDISL